MRLILLIFLKNELDWDRWTEGRRQAFIHLSQGEMYELLRNGQEASLDAIEFS